MDFIYNMWIVAKFETKTLLRSWFFRIFALLAIIILALLDLVLYTNLAPLPWSFRGIPSLHKHSVLKPCAGCYSCFPVFRLFKTR